MSNTTINPSAFLPNTKKFPNDINYLTLELDKNYLDTATAVNNRTIGLFPTIKPAFTGESWYFNNNQKQQGLRQVYTFTSTTSIDHNIDFNNATFTKCEGSFTDGTNWYGISFASNVAVAGQITFYLTSTQIVFLTGAGAPTLTSGLLIIEWVSVP